MGDGAENKAKYPCCSPDDDEHCYRGCNERTDATVLVIHNIK